MQCFLCYTFPINNVSVNSRVVILVNIAYVSEMQRTLIEEMILANEQAKEIPRANWTMSCIWASG